MPSPARAATAARTSRRGSAARRPDEPVGGRRVPRDCAADPPALVAGEALQGAPPRVLGCAATQLNTGPLPQRDRRPSAAGGVLGCWVNSH